MGNKSRLLLVDVHDVARAPADELLSLEPETDLAVGRLDRVRAVDDVAANINAKVTADGARGRLEGLGGADELATSLNDSLACKRLLVSDL